MQWKELKTSFTPVYFDLIQHIIYKVKQLLENR